MLAGTEERLVVVTQLKEGCEVEQGEEYINFLNAFIQPLLQAHFFSSLASTSASTVTIIEFEAQRSFAWNHFGE